MNLFQVETLPVSYSPLVVGRVACPEYIGVTKSHIAFLREKWGITGDISYRQSGHILSLDQKFATSNGKDVSHIFAFINAANSEFFKENQGPLMFLQSLSLIVS